MFAVLHQLQLTIKLWGRGSLLLWALKVNSEVGLGGSVQYELPVVPMTTLTGPVLKYVGMEADTSVAGFMDL